MTFLLIIGAVLTVVGLVLLARFKPRGPKISSTLPPPPGFPDMERRAFHAIATSQAWNRLLEPQVFKAPPNDAADAAMMLLASVGPTEVPSVPRGLQILPTPSGEETLTSL